MTKVTSAILAGFILDLDGTEYYMEKGTEIDEMVVAGPYENTTISGVLAGFSIRDRHAPNSAARIYDGIPTREAVLDNLPNIKDLELCSEIDKLLIATNVGDEETPKYDYTRVNVDRIVSVSGTFVDPYGNTTETVDLEDETVDVPTLIAEADPETRTTLVLSEGEVDAPITVVTEMRLVGQNANKPQNFDQNPEEEVVA